MLMQESPQFNKEAEREALLATTSHLNEHFSLGGSVYEPEILQLMRTLPRPIVVDFNGVLFDNEEPLTPNPEASAALARLREMGTVVIATGARDWEGISTLLKTHQLWHDDMVLMCVDNYGYMHEQGGVRVEPETTELARKTFDEYITLAKERGIDYSRADFEWPPAYKRLAPVFQRSFPIPIIDDWAVATNDNPGMNGILVREFIDLTKEGGYEADDEIDLTLTDTAERVWNYYSLLQQQERLPVDSWTTWRVAVTDYIAKGQHNISSQIGKATYYPETNQLVAYTGEGSVGISFSRFRQYDLGGHTQRQLFEDLIVVKGLQRKIWRVMKEETPTLKLERTGNYIPDLPIVGSHNSTRLVTGIDLNMELGLQRENIIGLENFSDDVVTFLYNTNQAFWAEMERANLPPPHDEVLISPEKKIHALIQPKRQLNPRRTGEGDIYFVDVLSVDPNGEPKVQQMVEKVLNATRSGFRRPSQQIEDAEILYRGGVNTYNPVELYRNSDNIRLYMPDLTEGDTRRVIDGRDRLALPAWVQKNRYEIATQLVRNAEAIARCGFYSVADTYFILEPKGEGNSVEIFVGDLGQGLEKKNDWSVRDLTRVNIDIVWLFVNRLELLTWEEWQTALPQQ